MDAATSSPQRGEGGETKSSRVRGRGKGSFYPAQKLTPAA
jgi:hypothetical protein